MSCQRFLDILSPSDPCKFETDAGETLQLGCKSYSKARGKPSMTPEKCGTVDLFSIEEQPAERCHG